MHNRVLVLRPQADTIENCAIHRGEAVSRLFIAMEVPHPFKAAIRDLQSGLPNARWLNVDGLHMTLAFVGEADDTLQHRIETGLSTVCATEFGMEMRGVGRFPPRGAPRVLWVGAAPEAEIVTLANAVRSTLGNIGLAVDRRAFLPHVTVARFRQRPPVAALKTYLAANADFRTGKANIAAFHLFSSELQPDGARYTIEKTFLLTRTPRENGARRYPNRN